MNKATTGHKRPGFKLVFAIDPLWNSGKSCGCHDLVWVIYKISDISKLWYVDFTRMTAVNFLKHGVFISLQKGTIRNHSSSDLFAACHDGFNS